MLYAFDALSILFFLIVFEHACVILLCIIKYGKYESRM